MQNTVNKTNCGLARSCQRELSRFRADQSGAYLIIAGLLMPVLVGFVGFGTDATLWYYKHRTMQDAADSAALSAATAYSNGINDVTAQANAVASSYGYVTGTKNATVTVNKPPLSGPNVAKPDAIEVIVQQPQNRLFSALFGSGPANVLGRAVAEGKAGTGCVLALDKTKKGAATDVGAPQVVLNGCSLLDNSNHVAALVVSGAATLTALSVEVVGGIEGVGAITTTPEAGNITTGVEPMADPYADRSFPSFSGCDQNDYSTHSTVTLSPGVYCGGIALQAHANVTLSPGIYYLNRGALDVHGQAALTGTGVTLVFTDNNAASWANATINGGATINLTAPATGPTAGIVFFGDRAMPTGDKLFRLNGGSTQVFNGAIYLPQADVEINGASSTGDPNACTQLIADTIKFTGNAEFRVNCTGKGTKVIGAKTATLLE